MKSIRVYLLLALLSTITLGSFVAAVNGYQRGMDAAEALLDEQLQDFAILLRQHPGSERVVPAPSQRVAYQLWTRNGMPVTRSENSGERPIMSFEPGYRDANFGGHRWRVLTQYDLKTERWIQVAERIDLRVGLTENVVLTAVLPILAILPVVAALVWVVVGHGLAVLRRLARDLDARRADDLSPLVAASPPVELAPVVDAVNDLLRRLDESITRERRFSADAAHELRTPIAALKVHAHNLKRNYPEVAPELEVLDLDLGRLGHLVDQMLMLYRMTPEHYVARMRNLNLREVASGAVGDLYGEIDRRGQTIELTGPEATINGDPEALRIMLVNLISNASKYSPKSSAIRVAIDREDGAVALRVSDSGPGIADEELERVFDRFHRGGGDRHASHVDGCGLGLSIVRHIADLHGATVDLSNNSDRPGLTALVRFDDVAPGRKKVRR